MKFALIDKYPIETADQLTKAAEYFDKNLYRFSPSDRVEIARSIDKQASALCVNIERDWIKNYTRMDKSGMVSPDFESSMRLRKEACVRYGVKLAMDKSIIKAADFVDGIVKMAFSKKAEEEMETEEGGEASKETEKEEPEDKDETKEEEAKEEASEEEKEKAKEEAGKSEAEAEDEAEEEAEAEEEKTSGLAKRASKAKAKEVLLTLMTLDKEAGLEYLYDNQIVDPIMTVFGSLNNPEYDAVKVAGDATQYDLVRASRTHEKLASIKEKLGEKFAAEFRLDPIRSVGKLGGIETQLLSEVARS